MSHDLHKLQKSEFLNITAIHMFGTKVGNTTCDSGTITKLTTRWIQKFHDEYLKVQLKITVHNT